MSGFVSGNRKAKKRSLREPLYTQPYSTLKDSSASAVAGACDMLKLTWQDDLQVNKVLRNLDLGDTQIGTKVSGWAPVRVERPFQHGASHHRAIGKFLSGDCRPSASQLLSKFGLWALVHGQFAALTTGVLRRVSVQSVIHIANVLQQSNRTLQRLGLENPRLFSLQVFLDPECTLASPFILF